MMLCVGSFMLGNAPPESLDMICAEDDESDDGSGGEVKPLSALSLVLQAEYLYREGRIEDSFRVASQAYLVDPYDWRGNIVYIGTMVNLSLKNELFYLGTWVVTPFAIMLFFMTQFIVVLFKATNLCTLTPSTLCPGTQ